MNYSIRKATINDAKRLNELLTLFIRDEKKYDNNINTECKINSYYEYIIDKENNYLLVAESSNKIIGYLYGKIMDDGNTVIDKVAKIDALYIDENYRHQGIGSSLINEFKKIVKEENVKYIEVNACNDNKEAITTYKNNGFNEIKAVTIRQEI